MGDPRGSGNGARTSRDETPFDTDVLVVGTGPAGATCALALATYGIRVRAVTKWHWLANGPRAHIMNQRALEVLRDLGIEDQVTAVATPWDLMGDMVFATSLAGEEIARLRTWGTGDARRTDYLQGSPCPLLDVPQPYLEPVLVRNAAARGASVAFNTEYIAHVQDQDGVTSTLRDRLTGHEYTVRSRFLVGADGARSRIVAELGLPIEGVMARAGTVYAEFKADLTNYVAHRPSILHRILIPSARFGEMGLATLRAIRPWGEWIAGWGYDHSGPEPDLRPEAVLPRIREMIGDEDVEVEVQNVYTWSVNQSWATRYSAGRVFCMGDAVHRHPPSSGLGSNTSIQDAFNLAWKLNYVVRGWADSSLLESFSPERAPIGQEVVARANQSRLDYGPLREAFWVDTEGDRLAASLARLADPGPSGVASRDALATALEIKNAEFNAQGTESNQRYTSRAVVTCPGTEPESWDRDRGLYLQATTRPGAKIPHVWLVDRAGRRRSTLDVTGQGGFCLVTGLAGTAWTAAATRMAVPFLRVVVIGAPDARDAYHDWRRVRQIDEAGAILVRPDGYIAWHHVGAMWDEDAAFDELSSILSSILGTTAVGRAAAPYA